MNPTPQPNTPVRIEAIKGFYAVVSGQFGIVNPGDVVETDRHVAAMVVAAGKAVWAQQKDLKRQTDYKSERKAKPKRDQAEQLEALTSAVEALTKVVLALDASRAPADGVAGAAAGGRAKGGDKPSAS